MKCSMESFKDDVNATGFGCKTVCFVRTNGDLHSDANTREAQTQITNELVTGKRYKYAYSGLNLPIYIGKYLRTDGNRSFFQEDDGKEICIVYSSDLLIYFISMNN